MRYSNRSYVVWNGTSAFLNYLRTDSYESSVKKITRMKNPGYAHLNQ